MDRSLLTFLGAALLLFVASVIVATGRASEGFADWLFKYQTLTTGVLAIVSAGVTIWWMRRGVQQAADLAEDDRQRSLASVRAELPLALSAICGYAERCGAALQQMIDNSVDFPDHIQVPPDYVAPETPSDAVRLLRECVRYADVPKANEIADLLSEFQVQNVGIRNIPLDAHRDRLSRYNVYHYVIETAELYARASSLFDFARREAEGGSSPISREAVRSGLNLTGFWRGAYPDIDAIVDRRWREIPKQ